MRSALEAFEPRALGTLHLVSTDLPANKLLGDILDNVSLENRTRVVDAARVGQVPSWLNRSSASAGRLEVHHHSSFFDNKVDLPTFNSLSIESQLPNLLGLSEFFLYMNVRRRSSTRLTLSRRVVADGLSQQDDTFLSGNMSSSDVGAPFLGPAFRIQRDLQVDALGPGIVGAFLQLVRLVTHPADDLLCAQVARPTASGRACDTPTGSSVRPRRHPRAGDRL